jgi:hypothetical protein
MFKPSMGEEISYHFHVTPITALDPANKIDMIESKLIVLIAVPYVIKGIFPGVTKDYLVIKVLHAHDHFAIGFDGHRHPRVLAEL